MPRKFTKDRVAHIGFSHYNQHSVITSSDILVIIWFEDSSDMYICDNWEGVQGVVKMYTDEWGEDRIKAATWTGSESYAKS